MWASDGRRPPSGMTTVHWQSLHMGGRGVISSIKALTHCLIRREHLADRKEEIVGFPSAFSSTISCPQPKPKNFCKAAAQCRTDTRHIQLVPDRKQQGLARATVLHTTFLNTTEPLTQLDCDSPNVLVHELAGSFKPLK
ncbi:unnamed protein product [Pleuronectes platessa]|uniref:Uncharacterized protein n=1 Tax=Pleuronectes platessa TaxID=8262 RepID=A0A9N7TFX5_PLEPL|nr:unnamed protein product [Pleuronectes platessa]